MYSKQKVPISRRKLRITTKQVLNLVILIILIKRYTFNVCSNITFSMRHTLAAIFIAPRSPSSYSPNLPYFSQGIYYLPRSYIPYLIFISFVCSLFSPLKFNIYGGRNFCPFVYLYLKYLEQLTAIEKAFSKYLLHEWLNSVIFFSKLQLKLWENLKSKSQCKIKTTYSVHKL